MYFYFTILIVRLSRDAGSLIPPGLLRCKPLVFGIAARGELLRLCEENLGPVGNGACSIHNAFSIIKRNFQHKVRKRFHTFDSFDADYLFRISESID